MVQGVAGAGRIPELGYIPCGTVNDVAHSLGIPKRLGGALKVILSGERALLDCMKINDRYAMYIVAAGAFTSATYSTPQKLKRQIGRIAYGVEGIRKNMNFEVFDIDITAGGVRERTDCVFVALMNGRYVAGMRLNRRGSMADGQIEAAVIRQCRKPNFFQRVRAFFSLANLFLFGYGVREKNISRIRGSHFEIDAGDSVVWNFDGERGICGKVVVDVLPKRIPVLVPRGRKRFRAVLRGVVGGARNARCRSFYGSLPSAASARAGSPPRYSDRSSPRTRSALFSASLFRKVSGIFRGRSRSLNLADHARKMA